jgi:hypothetical protein
MFLTIAGCGYAALAAEEDSGQARAA